jgi:hypothetical protein
MNSTLEEDSIEALEPFYDGAEEEGARRHGDEICSTYGPLSEEALYKCARLHLFAGTQLSNLSATFFILNSYSAYAGFFGHPPAHSLRLIDLHASLTRKYLSIFEHIQVYLRYFKEYSKNISNMSGLYQK